MKLLSLLLSLMFLFAIIIIASSLVLAPIIFRKRITAWFRYLIQPSFSCHRYQYSDLNDNSSTSIKSYEYRKKSRIRYRSSIFHLTRLLRKLNRRNLQASILLHYNLYRKRPCPAVSLRIKE